MAIEKIFHTHTKQTKQNLILALLIFNIVFLAISSQYCFISYKGCWEPVDITNTGYHSTRVVQLIETSRNRRFRFLLIFQKSGNRRFQFFEKIWESNN
jgi:Na+/melibiose symporter-like transporter